jgi:hypothetical protein
MAAEVPIERQRPWDERKAQAVVGHFVNVTTIGS